VDGIKFRRQAAYSRYVTGETLTGDTSVFVEIKTTLDRVTQKRRVVLSYAMHVFMQRPALSRQLCTEDKAVFDEIYAYLWQYNLHPVSHRAI